MKTKVRLVIAAAVFSMLAACNTIEGVGEDVEATGESVSNAARNAGN